jgi:hypothetical protein
LISYRTLAGEELARAHRYIGPDGKIGASGKPDPKRVYKDGKLYRIKSKKQLAREALASSGQ